MEDTPVSRQDPDPERPSAWHAAALQHAGGYLVFGVLWIFGTDYGLGKLGPGDPALLTLLATIKGVGFVGISALWFFLVLRQFAPGWLSSGDAPPSSQWQPLLVFLLVAVSLLATGHLFLRSEEAAVRAGRARELAAMAESATAGISRWLDIRRAMLDTMLTSPMLHEAASQWRRSYDVDLRTRIEARLAGLRTAGGFDALDLYAREGRRLVAVGPSPGAPLEVQVLRLIESAAASRRLQQGITGQVAGGSAGSIVWVVPLLPHAAATERADLFIVATADFNSLTNGIVGPVPQIGRTAETLLIRREAGAVLFVSPRSKPGPAASAPGEAGPGVPALAIADGETGLIESRDYAGDAVLAVGRRVAGTDLYVAAKINADEAFSRLRYTSVRTGLFMLVILALAALALWTWWRNHQRLLRIQLARLRSALDLQREHFAMANRFANDAILLIDVDRKLVEINDRALTMYGLDRDTLLTLRVDDLREPGAERAGAPAQFAQVLADGSLRFETVHRRGDGTTFPVEVSSRRFELDGREFVQSIVRDITERRRHEEALRSSEARYRLLFEDNPHPMWVYDLETLGFLAVNEAAVGHYGYSREQFLAMTIADIRPAEDVPRLLSSVRKVRDGALDKAGLWRHRKADGSLIDVEIRSHVLEFGGRRAELVLAHDVTLRLALEGKLRESESRMRLFIEYAPAALAMFDRNMCYLSVSNRWLVEYHLGSRSLTGQRHYDVFPEISEEWKSVHRRALAGEVVRAEEDRFQRADGSVQWLRWEVRPWYADDASIGGIVVFSEDISDICETRRRLEHRTRLYDMLSQCNQTIVRVGDRNELYHEMVRLAVERGGFQFTWIGESQLDGCLSLRALHGVDESGVAELREILPASVLAGSGVVQEALGSGRPVLCNDFLADPRVAPMHEAAARLGIGSCGTFPFAERGRPKGVLGLYARQPGYFDADTVETLDEMSRDISFALDSLHSRRELEESQRLLQAVIDSSEAIIYVMDRDGRFLLLNEACARAIGAPLGSFVGRSREELMPAEAAAVHRANDLQVIESGKATTFEEVNPEADGTHVYLSVKYPLHDADGRLYAIGGISTDITELRRAGEALEESNRSLEARVAERTYELEEARDQALAADRAKTAFLATLSHELRSPLNSIIGFTSVLLEGMSGPLSPAQAQQLNVVRDASRHLLEIINDMLDLSKIEAGVMALASETFDLQQLVVRLKARFAVLATQSGLYLRQSGEAQPCPLRGDSRRVEQVLGNLLSNAIKFTGTGGVTIGIDRGPVEVKVTVADTGPGIAEADRPRLFRRFSQLEPGEGVLAQGTGLGLAIASGLAEAMGGRIELESEPGRGSAFTLVLPAGAS